MSNFKDVILEFESISNKEIDEIKHVIDHSQVQGDSELERRVKELRKMGDIQQSISEIAENVYRSDDPNYISELGNAHELEKKREEISEDIIQFLEKIRDYLITNDVDDVGDIEVIEKVIRNEERLREIEISIESEFLKQFRKKAYDRAKIIMNENRFHIKFRESALQDFLEFSYKETFEDPVKEAAGAFRFKEIQVEGKREFDYLIEEFIPCTEYQTRDENEVKPSKDFIEKVRQRNNLAFCHTHPPGAQKSHSKRDSTHNGIFNILAVPESRRKIWVVAQSKDEYNNWINHPIEVSNGRIPQAHLKKYNKAIVKALAYKGLGKELREELGSWKKVKEEFEDHSFRSEKQALDEKLFTGYNSGGEKQWLRYLKQEEY